MAPHPTQTLSSTAEANFTPYLDPPAGTTSNPEHPESLAQLADITIGICLPLVTAFFLGRCYVRLFLKRVWILEDYLVSISWAGAVAYCAVMRATMSHHGGEHGWDLTAAQAHEASYWFNVTSIEYGSIIGITKCALLMFYRRVFSPVRRSPFDITLVALMVIMAGFYSSNTFVKIFECNPRSKIWDNKIPGKCVDLVLVLNVSGGFNAVSDFIILLLPVHAVSKLQMTMVKRVVVILGFTFGLCGPIFATVGFVVRLRQSGNKDTTWNQCDILLWAAAELATGNLCVCFPEVAFLFRKKNRKVSRRRVHPSDSQLQRGWNERAIKKPAETYFSKSLMSTILTKSGDKDYIELQDRRNDHQAQVTPMKRSVHRQQEPEDGVILLENEVKVERLERPMQQLSTPEDIR